MLLSIRDKSSLALKGKDSVKNNQFLEAVFGSQKLQTKKELERDRKVEALLQAYKKKDEESLRKEQEKAVSKKINQKALLEKFGFSDEEEDEQLIKALVGHKK